MKKCIFHVPNYISPEAYSGSQVRPMKMLNAFRNIGYEVDFIMGFGKERKMQIQKIKKNIVNGIKYDFLYSESSTMPTLLTEKHHLPTYPTLDFGFFKLCKKSGIKIVLFYRDLHWKFPQYAKNVGFIKNFIATRFYTYDVQQYEKLLDIFYVPAFKLNSYLMSDSLKSISKLLIPGGSCYPKIIEKTTLRFNKNRENKRVPIKIFYVGGVGNVSYIINELINAVYEYPLSELTICCRKNEWIQYKEQEGIRVNERIKVVHETGLELEKYYNEADICAAFFQPEEYRNMASPIKVFEYLGHCIPILATTGSAVGEFVEKNNIGWTIPYDKESVISLLEQLVSNRDMLYKTHCICKDILKENTWEKRAEQVVYDTSS